MSIDVAVDETAQKPNLGEGVQERMFPTCYGDMRVVIEGDLSKEGAEVVVTYHDVGLTYESCWKTFFNYAKQREDVFDRFVYVHFTAPGQHIGASLIPDDVPALDMNKLIDILLETLDTLGVSMVTMAMGVGCGAYLLAGAGAKQPNRFLSAVYLGPDLAPTGWIEWWGKWMNVGVNYLFGQKRGYKRYFLDRWFAPNTIAKKPSLVSFYMSELDRIEEMNMWKFLQGYHLRAGLLTEVSKLSYSMLLFVGYNTLLEDNCSWMLQNLNPQSCWLRPKDCGTLVCAERPSEMLQPVVLMLAGLGIK